MEGPMKWMLCVGLLTLLMTSAKADVVCNESGCFHRHDQRSYYGERHRDDYYGDRRYRDDQQYRHPPRTCTYVAGVRICQ